MCAFYERQGAAGAHKAVRRCEELFPRLWLVCTADRMTDREGHEIVRWQHLYLLSETGVGPRAMAAIADGEVAAWEALGTPLGPSQ